MKIEIINCRERGDCCRNSHRLLYSLCFASLWLILGSGTALADEPASFGRLFISPNTRLQLDESRRQHSTQRSNLPVVEETEEENAPLAVKVDGMIMRRDGSTEVWINGVKDSQYSRESRHNVNHTGGNRFQVTVPGGEQVTLKPGQVYSLETRRVVEGYEAGKELELEQQEPLQATADGGQKQDMQSDSSSKEKAVQSVDAGKPGKFDESELVEQDSRIKLLEERLEKLEQGADGKN